MLKFYCLNRDGGCVFVFMYGDSRRVNPSNEAMTGRRYGKMDEVNEGKEGGSATAAAAALCIVTL